MRIHWVRFNFYLLWLLVAITCGGCSTTGEKRRLSTFSVHMEASSSRATKSNPVPIYRARPVEVNADPEPFVNEAFVSKAEVIDVIGGFALRITLERRGAWLLEQYTTANRGRRMAIQAEFADPADPKHKKRITRWLAAPLISQPINNGVLVFTPDCSREEAEELVRGLNNLARKLNDNYSW